MRALGRELAAHLLPGEVLALQGDLGAGKTTLVRAIAAAWGVAEEAVSSPTFALCNLYDGDTVRIAHLDLYRLGQTDDVVDAGLDEWLGAPDVVCLVEWPDVAAPLFPQGTRTLHLAIDGEGRRLTVT